MRTSKKLTILQAAIPLVEADGVEAITYEALAAATGLSKSGLIYHFPSRHALLLALHSYLAAEWASQLADAAGASPTELSEAERLRAYITTLADKATRADVLIAIDAHSHPDYLRQWQQVSTAWSPTPESNLYPLRLMADGLWLHDQINENPLTQKQRQHLQKQLLIMLDQQTC
ncbi:TetR family transcriptional regulator [Staphylococcus chromogenes]|nr:TetR family transcriptional regulator [Staphylococcus chromogenes]